jgi:hypothetical protein
MGNITMQPVKSSQIKSVGYDKEAQTLYIEFLNGTVYMYSKVPLGTYTNLMVPTMSVGKYFFAEIKGKFEYEKLPYTVVDGQLHQI